MNFKIYGAGILVLAAIAIIAAFLFMPQPPTAPPPQSIERAVEPPRSGIATATSVSVPGTMAPSARASVTEPFPGMMMEDAWVERLDSILTSDEDSALAARKLIATLPQLPPEAQEEYVAHAVNLCEDDEFAQLETVYLATNTPPAVVETIFDDALNRPDELKLPMLAKTLRNPSHPMAGEAREILEMYLDLEPGAAPAAGWEAAVQQYLRDEAAAS